MKGKQQYVISKLCYPFYITCKEGNIYSLKLHHVTVPSTGRVHTCYVNHSITITWGIQCVTQLQQKHTPLDFMPNSYHFKYNALHWSQFINSTASHVRRMYESVFSYINTTFSTFLLVNGKMRYKSHIICFTYSKTFKCMKRLEEWIEAHVLKSFYMAVANMPQ